MGSVADRENSLQLITSHQRALYGYIMSLVGSRDAADEVLQETNVVLCRKIGEFDGRVKFITWACRVAYFEVLARSRRTQRRGLLLLDGPLLDQIASKADGLAGGADPRIHALRECMAGLPPHSRELIEQRYESGGSVRSIAGRLQRSVGGVRVTLHRIRKVLLDCIERKLAARS